MNQRIKEVRKALGLTQDEFGRRLGVTRGAITNIEYNKVEPKPLLVSLLCREFGVSETWLRTGQGEMFVPLSEDAEFDAMMTQIQESDDDMIKAVLRAYWGLDDDQKAAIRTLLDRVIDNLGKEKAGK